MKRVAVICVMLAGLWICAPLYGYVLVYNVTGMIKAVDTEANAIDRTLVQGYLVAEVDEEEEIIGAKIVLYGRDEERNKVYMTSDAVSMMEYGNCVVVIADVGQGGSIVLTGTRTWERRIGLAGRRNVVSMLDGDIRVIDGTLFDLDQTLIGTGFVSAILDLRQTRDANGAQKTLDDVIDDAIERLEARGFAELEGEEEPTLPG